MGINKNLIKIFKKKWEEPAVVSNNTVNTKSLTRRERLKFIRSPKKILK